MTYQKPLSMFVAVALTAGALVAVAPPAFAQTQRLEVVAERITNPTRRVAYADLNLASAAGEKALNQRVGRAVSTVCNKAIGDGFDPYAEHACRSDAWAGARPQMALAVQRAREIAATGSSNIAAVAISVAFAK